MRCSVRTAREVRERAAAVVIGWPLRHLRHRPPGQAPSPAPVARCSHERRQSTRDNAAAPPRRQASAPAGAGRSLLPASTRRCQAQGRQWRTNVRYDSRQPRCEGSRSVGRPRRGHRSAAQQARTSAGCLLFDAVETAPRRGPVRRPGRMRSRRSCGARGRALSAAGTDRRRDVDGNPPLQQPRTPQPAPARWSERGAPDAETAGSAVLPEPSASAISPSRASAIDIRSRTATVAR